MPGKKYSLRSVLADQLTFDPSKEEGDKKRTNAEELAEWCRGSVARTNGPRGTAPQVVLEARTGTRVANVGDYIVELSAGNFTVYSEAEFDRTYDTGKKS